MSQPPRIKIVLMHDAPFQYFTEGGQVVVAVLPAGTKLLIPASWYYEGVPPDSIVPPWLRP